MCLYNLTSNHIIVTQWFITVVFNHYNLFESVVQSKTALLAILLKHAHIPLTNYLLQITKGFTDQKDQIALKKCVHLYINTKDY